MKKQRILIVDDDPAYLAKLRQTLEGVHTVECASGRDDFVTLYRPYRYDLLILDMRLDTEREGLELARAALDQDPLQPIIIMTAYADTESHIEAIAAGAMVYLNKADFSPLFIGQMVDAVLRQKTLERRVTSLEKQIARLEPSDIIGVTPGIENLKDQIRKAAIDGGVTVLVRGESGTGKELVARALHHWSPLRKDGPFIPVSIAGLHKETMHSDLFGHEKGAFTGANVKRRGYIEEAHQGVLFLDEIGDLDPEAQVKLLRVLETRTFVRLGGNSEIGVDIQVVSATHQDLEQDIDRGRFRRDLYYRLRGFEITAPPLRERVSDIPLLAHHFLNRMALVGRTVAGSFDPEVIQAFSISPWPGNVRELKNVVEYAAIQCRAAGDRVVSLEHLPKEFSARMGRPKESAESADYQRYLAQAELGLIARTMELHQTKTKTDLAQLLGYNDRFTFMRRVRRALSRYPELATVFKEVASLYG